jgi:hypothetical protein
MNTKRFFFWTLTYLVSMVILELGLRAVYFQKLSDYPLALVAAFHDVRSVSESKVAPDKTKIGIWRKDPRYGYSHIASTTGTHTTPDFSVTYTIDEHQARFNPVPEHPLGRILFLGGSYTFGHGVNDNETFPAVLGEHWPQWQIDNRGVMGWGTSHSYMTLIDDLGSDDPPEMVVYTMIPHHITRNYIRESWVKNLSRFGRDHPHFELIDEELVFMGTIGVEEAAPGSPELRRKETELTNAFLIEMQDLCQQRSVPFIVVLLGNKYPPEFGADIANNGIQVVDLSELEFQGFARDPHPNSDDHRRIAEEIVAEIGAPIKRVRRR